MISFPHAKINLGLSVISKRPDGFHNLETIFYPLPVRDVLEIIHSTETRFIPTGTTVPGKTDENLVLRAYRLLKMDYPEITSLEIHLHKAIPMGAGLGGGSSDAAEIIQLINRFFRLAIPTDSLMAYALELGSDCPFFMQARSCFATGRGELLEPIDLDLSSCSFLLVHPEIRIETAWAFSKINPGPSKFNLREIVSQPLKNWPQIIHNDFEVPVFEAYPALQKIKDALYEAGALYASMTGSGSTIYGIFSKHDLPEISFENASQRKIE